VSTAAPNSPTYQALDPDRLPDPYPFPDPPENPWVCLRREAVYENPWIRVEHHAVRDAAQREGIYGVVGFRHSAIGIVVLDGRDTILVGQWRYPFQRYSWEIPAGGGAPNQSSLDTAQRELEEETGISAMDWQVLQDLQLSNSASDEIGTVFLARDCRFGTAKPSPEERLQTWRLPVEEAIALVHKRVLVDSLTVVGLLALESRLLRGLVRLPAAPSGS
jgi:8-oxo-dGTP pyrophosphatase MutT (NUDIX family)